MVFLQWLCRKVWESEIILICDSNGYVIVSVAWYTYIYRPLKAELMVHYDNSVHVSCHIHSTWTNHSPPFLSYIIPITMDQTCRSQWLRGLRLFRSLTCCDRGFESHQGQGCLAVVSAVCCQVGVSAMGWSLVQRSPTDCGASLCVIKKTQKWGGYIPQLGCERYDPMGCNARKTNMDQNSLYVAVFYTDNCFMRSLQSSFTCTAMIIFLGLFTVLI